MFSRFRSLAAIVLSIAAVPAVMQPASVTYSIGSSYVFTTPDFLTNLSTQPDGAFQYTLFAGAMSKCDSCEVILGVYKFGGLRLTGSRTGFSQVFAKYYGPNETGPYLELYPPSEVWNTVGVYPRVPLSGYIITVAQNGDQVTFMPEPGTLGIVGLTLGGLMWRRRV